MNENNAVAIDFGTSRTKLAYFNPVTKQAELMNHGVEQSLPSYFAIGEDGKILLGSEAQKRVESGERQTVSNIKGLISELVIKGKPLRRVGKTPQELLTALFTYLKKETGKLPAFWTEPQTAYLTHPTTFSENDQEILQNAAQEAGFSVNLIEEPRAVAEYVRRSRRELPTDIIVLDCGAGTLHWAYMVQEQIYGDEPKHIISRDIEPGGTITGILDDQNKTKRVIGGSSVEEMLARGLENRDGRIKPDDYELLRHELKVRKELFCRNPKDELSPIKIRNFSVAVSSSQMKNAIKDYYITPACHEVAPYIKKVVDVTKAKGREPALLLTGGCAQIKDFVAALREKFGLNCIVIPKFEYATVLGALPFPEGIIRSELSEQSDRIETTESEKAVPHIIEMLNKSVKENFNEFGNEIGDLLASEIMSTLIKLVDLEDGRGLDIGGNNSTYLWSLHNFLRYRDGNLFVGCGAESTKKISSYFVNRISHKLNTDQFDVNECAKILYGEGLLETIPSPKPVLPILEDCVRKVQKVVENILDRTLTDVDIMGEIEEQVEGAQSLRRVTFLWTTSFQNPIFRGMRASNRKYRATLVICEKLKEQLEGSRNTHEVRIRHAVVEVLNSTAEELCQQLIDESDRIESRSTSKK